MKTFDAVLNMVKTLPKNKKKNGKQVEIQPKNSSYPWNIKPSNLPFFILTSGSNKAAYSSGANGTSGVNGSSGTSGERIFFDDKFDKQNQLRLKKLEKLFTPEVNGQAILENYLREHEIE